MTEATDWDRYYRNTPRYTSVTRKISERKIIGLVDDFCGDRSLEICELGGANSCFVSAIFRSIDVAAYHVVDFNEFGLGLLDSKGLGTRLSWERGDVLVDAGGARQFDLVYSVGLIEHFQPEETRQAVQNHFARCKSGGIVLITFPTPTLPYRAIRSLAESSGKWSFPDERPLEFAEVRSACLAHGTIVHESINWMIGLTQGYVVARKHVA